MPSIIPRLGQLCARSVSLPLSHLPSPLSGSYSMGKTLTAECLLLDKFLGHPRGKSLSESKWLVPKSHHLGFTALKDFDRDSRDSRVP